MARRRSRRVHILLPDEAEQSRRRFLARGLAGALVLALGGGAWFARRRTQIAPGAHGPFTVFSPEEASILLAVADRLVPERAGFPRPAALSLAQRVDAVAARADPATRLELKRLLRLFESALTGFLLDAQVTVFTASSPAAQDRRLRAWAESRIAARRSGYRALKRLVYGAYYGAEESWAAVGYPGPPSPASARPPPPRTARRALEGRAPGSADGPAAAPAQPAGPDLGAPSQAPPEPARHDAAQAQPAGAGHAPQPVHAPPPPRRRRAFTPLKPFDEQPLEPAPTLITPRVKDG